MRIFLLLPMILSLGVTCCQISNKAAISPYDLHCDYLKDPIAIDNPAPALGWKLSANKNNQTQLAYHILASSSKTKAEQHIGDLWDTGRVESDQNQQIKYSGKLLSSRQQIFWRVRVWDKQNRASEWSDTACWEMSLLESSDWRAEWIGLAEDCCPDSPETDPAPFFRKEFDINQPIQSARVYVTGLGYYEFYLNGHKVSDYVLAPAQTNYDRRFLRNLLYPYDDQSTTRVLYNTFDITSYLVDGKNAAGIILGNGWYNQRDRRIEGWLWYDTPRFILQIEIEYQNGERHNIISDESWKVNTGPIIYNGIFTGEHYDARLELDEWDKPNYDDSSWPHSKIVRAPTGTLQSQLAPPDKVVKTIRPISMSNPQDGVFVYDMGQMMSGWVRLKVKGMGGDIIKLCYIEELGGDYGQQDVYIMKGLGIETFAPRFTWHAFRHVQVSGAKTLALTDLEGIVVNTAVDTVGSFECSNDLFNKIYRNYIWTQLGNFHGSLSSDCPHRERLGYTGDGQVLVESSIFNFDMTQFYHKWINDMDDARNKKTGYVPHTAPFGGGGGGPAWGSAYVIVPWLYYVYYGDRDMLSRHYAGMQRWVEYLGTRTDADGIVVREEPNGWCLGDWATPAKIELQEPLVNTCYYYYCADILSRAASVLDKEDDKIVYDSLKKNIKTAFNGRYFNKAEQRYWTSYQGADVFPLAFGLAPEENIAGVFASLVAHVEKNGGHLDTGILATPLLLEILTDRGRADLAFTIMNQRDFPGFGHYILGKGATTLWEEWDGRGSHSHPMYGSVIRWFYKALGGIRPDPEQPGFKHIVLKPTPCGDLTFVKTHYNSLYGLIRSDWRIKKNLFIWNIEIPVNTSATLFVPAADQSHVIVSDSEGVSFLKQENNRAVFQVGSGKYQFKSKNIRAIMESAH